MKDWCDLRVGGFKVLCALKEPYYLKVCVIQGSMCLEGILYLKGGILIGVFKKNRYGT